MPLSYFDNTMLSSWRSCRRKFYFSHIRHWRSQGFSYGSRKLVFGLAWHEAMDKIWAKFMQDDADRLEPLHEEAFIAFLDCWVAEGGPSMEDIESDPEEYEKYLPHLPQRAIPMLRAYIRTYESFLHSIEILAIEQPFALPITTYEGRQLYYTGRMDKIYLHNGLIYCMEHKTTGWYGRSNGFNNQFINSFYPNSQVDGYLVALQKLFPQYTLGGVNIDATLVHKSHLANLIIPQTRAPAMLDVFLYDAISDTVDIFREISRMEAMEENLNEGHLYPYMPAFPRNTKACFEYMSPCPFLDTCRYKPNPHLITSPPDHLSINPWSPFDVLELEKLDLEKE